MSGSTIIRDMDDQDEQSWGDDGSHRRFLEAFQRRRRALAHAGHGVAEPVARSPYDPHSAGLQLEIIAEGIGRTDRYLRKLLEGKGKRGPSFHDVEALDDFFAALGQPGLIEELRLVPGNWKVSTLPLDAVLPSDLLILIEGLRDTSLAPSDFIREKGLADHVHLLELDEQDCLRFRHLGRSIPLKLGPEVLEKDLRLLSDPNFAKVLYRQMLAVAAAGRPMLNRLESPNVSFNRLAVPVEGRKRGSKRTIVSYPHAISMSVSHFALE